MKIYANINFTFLCVTQDEILSSKMFSVVGVKTITSSVFCFKFSLVSRLISPTLKVIPILAATNPHQPQSVGKCHLVWALSPRFEVAGQDNADEKANI